MITVGLYVFRREHANHWAVWRMSEHTGLLFDVVFTGSYQACKSACRRLNAGSAVSHAEVRSRLLNKGAW